MKIRPNIDGTVQAILSPREAMKLAKELCSATRASEAV